MSKLKKVLIGVFVGIIICMGLYITFFAITNQPVESTTAVSKVIS